MPEPTKTEPAAATTPPGATAGEPGAGAAATGTTAPGSLIGKDPGTPAGPDSLLAKPEGEEGKEKAPEWKDVEYKFDLPEGISFADEGMAEISKLFNAAHLTQDAAKPLVDFYVKSVEEMVESIEKAGEAAWARTRTDWTNEI